LYKRLLLSPGLETIRRSLGIEGALAFLRCIARTLVV
jgi:hypothetical protein